MDVWTGEEKERMKRRKDVWTREEKERMKERKEGWMEGRMNEERWTCTHPAAGLFDGGEQGIVPLVLQEAL